MLSLRAGPSGFLLEEGTGVIEVRPAAPSSTSDMFESSIPYDSRSYFDELKGFGRGEKREE